MQHQEGAKQGSGGRVAENFLAKHTRYTVWEAGANGGEGAWQPETEPKPVSDM